MLVARSHADRLLTAPVASFTKVLKWGRPGLVVVGRRLYCGQHHDTFQLEGLD